MKKRLADSAAASQSAFLILPPSGSWEISVLMPRAFHLAKLEMGWEKTPMMKLGGMIVGIKPPSMSGGLLRVLVRVGRGGGGKCGKMSWKCGKNFWKRWIFGFYVVAQLALKC